MVTMGGGVSPAADEPAKLFSKAVERFGRVDKMGLNQDGVPFAVQHGTEAYTLVNAPVEQGDYFIALTIPFAIRKKLVEKQSSAIDDFVEEELAKLRDVKGGLSVVESGSVDVGYIFPNPAKCRFMQEYPGMGFCETPVLISLNFRGSSRLEGLTRLVSHAHVHVNPHDLAREVVLVNNKLLAPSQLPLCEALNAYLKKYYVPLLLKVAGA